MNLSWGQREIVSLLLPNAGIDSTELKLTVQACHPMYKSGKNKSSYISAFELAFALTIHKVRGRTFSSVILAHSSRPTKFQQMVL